MPTLLYNKNISGKEDEAMRMGEIIRQRRIELGLSQEELAVRCGFKSKSTISKMESGQRTTKQKNLLQVARALDLDPALLVAPEETAYLVTDPDIDLVVETMRTRPDLAAEIMKYVKYLLSQEA
jgi:transcriptional regulator with XRE-family HTH domain